MWVRQWLLYGTNWASSGTGWICIWSSGQMETAGQPIGPGAIVCGQKWDRVGINLDCNRCMKPIGWQVWLGAVHACDQMGNQYRARWTLPVTKWYQVSIELDNDPLLHLIKRKALLGGKWDWACMHVTKWASRTRWATRRTGWTFYGTGWALTYTVTIAWANWAKSGTGLHACDQVGRWDYSCNQ